MIRSKVKKMPEGKVFAIEELITRSLKTMAVNENIELGIIKARVLRTLSRLHEEGTLRRIQNGIYYKPEFSEMFKFELPPSIPEVIQVLAKKNHEILQVHGGEAANRIGLSTQMSIQATYYTNGTSREVYVAGSYVRFIRSRNKKLFQHNGTKVGVVISALNYLGKELVSENVLSKVKIYLSEDELNELMNSALPAWLNEELKSSLKNQECTNHRALRESFVLSA